MTRRENIVVSWIRSVRSAVRITEIQIERYYIHMSLEHKLTLNIPFETVSQAQIAQRTILVDPVLKKNEISVDYSVQDSQLVCEFAGVSDRVIRVAISNAIDNIKTIIECMDEFDGEKDTLFER